jgi:phosphate:Na+ symporter
LASLQNYNQRDAMMSFNCQFNGLNSGRNSLRNSMLVAGLLIISSTAGALALTSGGSGEASAPLDLWTMGVGMLGGLALFLYGMEQMADALKALAADRLKIILKRLTSNRYIGAVTGAIVTAVIQSSSVTTVLVVGFISAGVLSVSQAVGIIFGANIGSTLTAQLIAFKVTKLALLMVAIGFAMLFISRKDQVKQYGAMVMGLGLVFFGMSMMSDAMRPLRTYSPFIELMTRMEIPVLGILVGAVFTGLIQSSAATTGVVIAMSSQGLITLTGGIAIIFGANIGTCVTALLASIGKPRNAIKASIIHILFNVFGVVLWVGFIDRLAELVMMVSPVAEGLSGAEKLAAETPRQIANAHSIFNVANTLIFLPFGALFARLVEILLPDKEEEIDADTGLAVEFKTKFIDNDLLTVPSIALEQARNEIVRMAALVKGVVDDVLPVFMENKPKAAELMLAREEEVKYLGKELEQYLIEISRRNLNQQQSELSAQYMDINTDLKHIGKIVRKDYTQLLRRVAATEIKFSPQEHDKLLKYNSIVLENLGKAIAAFSEDSAGLARDIIRAKPTVVKQLRDYRALRFELSKEGNGEAVASRDAHLDLVDFLRRVYAYSEAIAFTMLEGYLDGRRDDRPEKIKPAMAEAV